ncbi:MAG: hypothetical protein LBF15_03475 [Candidatus Peribacteria bacterium]|jgi:hypothetical protein|nr:hypothetical protein [Candidatus Peribacteria bacterium]
MNKNKTAIAKKKVDHINPIQIVSLVVLIAADAENQTHTIAKANTIIS